MNDENEKFIKAAAEGAAEGLGKNIPPLYKDLFQPGVRQLGKAFGTVLGTINLALMPLEQAIWNYQTTSQWLHKDLAERLKDVSAEKIITPKASIVGPAIDSLKFLGEEPDLRNMFAKLISTAMNSDTADGVHPGFVEILKNLSATDAKMIKHIYNFNNLIFAQLIYSKSYTGFETFKYEFVSPINKDNLETEKYVVAKNNLERLGVCRVNVINELLDYFGKLPNNIKLFEEVEIAKATGFYGSTMIYECALTPFGNLLASACLDKD
ncbi:MAG TPA: DUF4393 domain-containing protein [Mucilaginibacter sp.]|jgi:hypothetical protein